jgi:cyclic pyranopterin phosphate synthase
LRRDRIEDGTMPLDGFGRRIDYLRISLIDECNLRCVYCMDPDDRGRLHGDALLDAREIGVVASAAAALGFKRIRLTGGEPTLRPDLLDVVRAVACVPGLEDLSLTTNGIRLPELAAPLAAAGLRRVNVHLDSLDPARLARIMRGARREAALAGIAAAEGAGLLPIKLNAVVVRDYNDDDVVALAALTLEHAWHVRFIETMPLGTGAPARVARERHVASAETRARIEAALGPLESLPVRDPSDESVNHRLPGARGIVGFISPVSVPYCGTCNRMRLTADGRFHLCLLNDDELDVRRVLREGGDATAVAAVLARAVRMKPIGHRLPDTAETTGREMFELGG